MPSSRRRCAPEADRLAVVAALADGTIDAIASDHQPRDADDKRLPFAQAEAGGAGLATLLGVTLARVHGGDLTAAAGARPADRAARPRCSACAAGRLAKGAPADLVLFDLERGWQVEGRRAAGQGAELALRRPGAGGPGARHLEGRAAGVRRMSLLLALALATCWARLPAAARVALVGLLLTRRRRGLGDIRAIGSGNIGATNVLRTGNKPLAAATLVLDIGKGAVALLARRQLLGRAGRAGGRLRRHAGPCLPGLARLQGRQGRGDRRRRAAGRRLVARPRRGAGLAGGGLQPCGSPPPRSLAACAAAPVVALLAGRPDLALFSAGIAALVVIRHRANIARLLAGTEPRIGRRASHELGRQARNPAILAQQE